MELTIECQKRAPGSKPNALRRSGFIPAVLYGHNGTESIELTVDAKTAETLVKKAVVNNTVIQLNVDDASWSGKTMLREVQAHPWKRNLYHLSFFATAGHGALTVTVPLHFVGKAAGLVEGGVLDTVITELEVQSEQDTIPDFIEVDVSSLKVGDALHLSDIALPTGVTTTESGDRVIVMVAASRGEGSGASAS